MAKVKLNLARMNVTQKVALSRTIKDQMTGNPDFPTPDPSLVQLETDTTSAEAASTAASAARSASQEATANLYTAEGVLDATLTSLGAYVEKTSGGNTAKILSTGMSVRNGRVPVTELPAVENLSVTGGDNDGEIDGQFDPIKGARSYEVQITTDPSTASSWTLRSVETRSHFTIAGLPSGTRQWFRVRAVGSRNIRGPWSDPAVKMVP